MTPFLHDPVKSFDVFIVFHPNINSFRNKYEMFAGFIENFNIFLISESKLDDTFPDKQFHINAFKIFKCERNRYGVV